MKIFIPIKRNSQRVPRKNFRSFNGVPLFMHTLNKLKDFEVYVDSDSEDVISACKSLDHVTAYKRSNTLIGDDVSVCDLIENCVKLINVVVLCSDVVEDEISVMACFNKYAHRVFHF